MVMVEQQSHQLDTIQRQLCSTTSQVVARDEEYLLSNVFEDSDALEKFDKKLAADATITMRLVWHLYLPDLFAVHVLRGNFLDKSVPTVESFSQWFSVSGVNSSFCQFCCLSLSCISQCPAHYFF